MPHEKVLDKVVDGIQGAEEHVGMLRAMLDKTRDEAAKLILIAQIAEARKAMLAWIAEYKAFTGTSAPIKKIIDIDMEQKWRVAQEAQANIAYERRLEQIRAAKLVQASAVEVVDGEIDDSNCMEGGEKDAG